MSHKKLLPHALALLLLSTQVAAQAPANHAAVLAEARKVQPEVIENLRTMVLVESGSDDHAGLAEMADFVEGKLKALGARTQRIPGAKGSATGLVVGTFEGTGSAKIVLQAHLDTVYKPGILKTEPYHREGNKLFGPGIADDKGGAAVILSSLDVLNRIGWKQYKSVKVIFNGDEEIGSPGSGDTIAKFGSDNDVVLSYEPSPAKAVAGHEGVLLGAAGTASVTLKVSGRAAHAGAAAGDGRNALVELANEIVATRDIGQAVQGAQLNWTMAAAGTARNQIPGVATATADVRLTEPRAGDALVAALKEEVDKHRLVPDTQTEISIDYMRPIFNAGDKGKQLAVLAKSIYGELGEGDLAEETTRAMPSDATTPRNLLLIPGTTGGTDAGFAASSGHPVVLESLGLAGWGYHARNEYIEVDSIVPRIYLTVRMIQELSEKPARP